MTNKFVRENIVYIIFAIYLIIFAVGGVIKNNTMDELKNPKINQIEKGRG